MPYRRGDSGVWWIRVKGQRQSSKTEDFAAAKALEGKLNTDAWLGDQMGAKAPKSFASLCEKWKDEKKGKASFQDDERIIAWWLVHLGMEQDVRRITRDRVDAIVREHREGVRPNAKPEVAPPANNTANHYVAILAAMLNAAARDWGWIESAPRLRLYPKPEPRKEWLTVEKWFELHAELPQHLQWAAKFALATGVRKAKVFGATWAKIDLKQRLYAYKGAANKLGNTIPLNETALSVLREIRASPLVLLDSVFTYRKSVLMGDRQTFKTVGLNDYGDAWWKALHRVGLGDWNDDGEWVGFTWHRLRHTFATWLDTAGVPPERVDQLGGWKVKGTARVGYVHNVEALRPHSEVIDRILERREVVPMMAAR